MSLETGRRLGLISSILFIILPVIAVVAFAGFVLAIISAATEIASSSAIPSSFLGMATGIGISFIVIGILGFVGLILFLVAMYSLSHYYKERGIFTNVIYAIILNFVTGVAVVIIEFLILFPSMTSISTSTPFTSPSDIFSSTFFIGIIAVLIVTIVITIISSILIYRAFNKLGVKSEVDSFKTAGLLYLIGVLLSVVVVGAVIIWIAFISAAIGFYKLKPSAPLTPPANTYYPQPPTPTQAKICPYCGADNSLLSTYCRNCGKPLQ